MKRLETQLPREPKSLFDLALHQRWCFGVFKRPVGVSLVLLH